MKILQIALAYFAGGDTYAGTTPNKTLKGIEAMNMIKKRQVNNLNYSVFNKVKYINQLFGIVL
jgi:hypothetical protein